jgi:hypothetical protein
MRVRGRGVDALFGGLPIRAVDEIEITINQPIEETTMQSTNKETQPTQPNPILKYFAYEHLPENLQVISKPFGELAQLMATTLPPSAETSAGLRKLLEAKDCAVRAALP